MQLYQLIQIILKVCNSVSSSSWSLQHIFTIVGTYNYQCDPHTSMGMVGTVIVNAVSSPNALTFTSIMDLTVPAGGSSGKALLLLQIKVFQT